MIGSGGPAHFCLAPASPDPIANQKEGLMRIALIGQAAFGADVLKGLIKQRQQVVGVFCPPDRGSKSTPSRMRPWRRASRFFNRAA